MFFGEASCDVCRQVISVDQDQMGCDSCKFTLHRRCGGMSKEEYREKIRGRYRPCACRSCADQSFVCEDSDPDELVLIQMGSPRPFDDDEVDMNAEDGPVTFHVAENGSRRGRKKLFASDGYSYNFVKSTTKKTVWRCRFRAVGAECYGECGASVIQTGDTFVRGRVPHFHLGARPIIVPTEEEVRLGELLDISFDVRRSAEPDNIDREERKEDQSEAVDTPDLGEEVDTPDQGETVDTPDQSKAVDTPDQGEEVDKQDQSETVDKRDQSETVGTNEQTVLVDIPAATEATMVGRKRTTDIGRGARPRETDTTRTETLEEDLPMDTMSSLGALNANILEGLGMQLNLIQESRWITADMPPDIASEVTDRLKEIGRATGDMLTGAGLFFEHKLQELEKETYFNLRELGLTSKSISPDVGMFDADIEPEIGDVNEETDSPAENIDGFCTHAIIEGGSNGDANKLITSCEGCAYNVKVKSQGKKTPSKSAGQTVKTKKQSKPEGQTVKTKTPSKPAGQTVKTKKQSKPEGQTVETKTPSKPAGQTVKTKKQSKPEGQTLETKTPSKPAGQTVKTKKQSKPEGQTVKTMKPSKSPRQTVKSKRSLPLNKDVKLTKNPAENAKN